MILLYVRAIVREFRWTLLALILATCTGALIYWLTPIDNGARPRLFKAFYAAWLALLNQVVFPPGPWFIGLVNMLFPLLGLVLIGEGVIRFGLLMFSRRHGEKEWMKVMASTYSNHVILCGLGHLGFRVYEQLVAAGVDVVVIELDENNEFAPSAKAKGSPVLQRNMKEDQSLIDAGVERARVIICCTTDDIGNIEVALDARRANPGIRVLVRLFDQRMAEKITGALTIDTAFSASALAAPLVAAMSLQARVASSIMIGGEPHVAAEVKVAATSKIAGQTIEAVETAFSARVLARTSSSGSVESPASRASSINPGDVLVIHSATSKLVAFSNACSA